MRLRAVELKVTDVPKAAEFLLRTWGLFDAGRRGRTRYFRGHRRPSVYVSLTPGSGARVDALTFAGSAAEISK